MGRHMVGSGLPIHALRQRPPSGFLLLVADPIIGLLVAFTATTDSPGGIPSRLL